MEQFRRLHQERRRHHDQGQVGRRGATRSHRLRRQSNMLRLEVIMGIPRETIMKDSINPSHYKNGRVEAIDAIESATVNKKE